MYLLKRPNVEVHTVFYGILVISQNKSHTFTPFFNEKKKRGFLKNSSALLFIHQKKAYF